MDHCCVRAERMIAWRQPNHMWYHLRTFRSTRPSDWAKLAIRIFWELFFWRWKVERNEAGRIVWVRRDRSKNSDLFNCAIYCLNSYYHYPVIYISFPAFSCLSFWVLLHWFFLSYAAIIVSCMISEKCLIYLRLNLRTTIYVRLSHVHLMMHY